MQARRAQLVRAPVLSSSRSNWCPQRDEYDPQHPHGASLARRETVLPASSAFLEDVEVFDSYIVAYFADAAGPRVNCMPAPLGSSSTAEAVLESRELRLPSKLGVVAPVRNAPFTSHRVSVSFSGPLVPQQICVFDMRTGRLVGLE
jgi:hypothetical protein